MDDDDNILPNHLFISLRHQFKATRVVDYRLSPTTIKIKTDISTIENPADNEEDFGLRMEIALAKMTHFVERVLDGSIIFHCENEWAMGCFLGEDAPETTNNVVMCPEDPTDAALCELILCKFKALTEGAFEFMSIEIEATDARGMSFLFVGSTPGDSFPKDEEWLTERNYFSRPWWHRTDASTLDIIPHEGADLNSPPAWAYSLGFLEDQMKAPLERNNVVVRGEFRPKVIEGGKVD